MGSMSLVKMEKLKLQADLRIASSKGQLDIVKQVIDAGADLDSRDNHSMTPIQLAAYYNHPLVVRELLKHGANAEVSTTFLGHTPLMLASRMGHLKVMTELLVNGADYQKVDKGGKTALDLAKNQDVTDAILDFQNQPGKKNGNESSIFEVTLVGDKTSTGKQCVVCLKPRREIAFLMNCGHITACLNCAQDIFRNCVKKECPTCKRPIQNVYRAYDC